MRLRQELTLAACREMGQLGHGLASPDPKARSEAGLLLSTRLRHFGLDIGGLLHHRREWGARPDLRRCLDVLARHFAKMAWPLAERRGYPDEVLETLEVCRDVDGARHPADMLRVLGMFAVAFGDVLDPDTQELTDEK